MGKLIGIDYGLKRVGFAISDEEKIIASRLCNKKTHESFEFLKTFIQNNDIGNITNINSSYGFNFVKKKFFFFQK